MPKNTKDMKNKYGSTHVRTHTHMVLARVQYKKNRPAHLVLHTRKSSPEREYYIFPATQADAGAAKTSDMADPRSKDL